MNQIVKRLGNVNLQVRNILQIYNQATENEIITGINWYQQANEISKLMGVKYSLTVHQAAGIISALSPGTNWSQNIIDSNNFCSLLNAGKNIQSVVVTTYGRNKLKAYEIYLHPELTEDQIYKLLLGASKYVNKTSSFYLNILKPDQNDKVTIDRHSIRVNLGVTELITVKITEKRYRILMEAYKQAGNGLEINAIQLQAVTWLVFRRLYIQVHNKQFEEVPF